MTSTTRTPRPLTPKQAAFVREYLVDLNATQAAIRAGYSAKTANREGTRLLSKAVIRSRVEAATAKRSERVELTQDYVITGIREVVERCMQKIPVLDGDGVPSGEWRFEPNATLKGYELLAKHLGMLRDRISLENPDGSALVEGNALQSMAAILAVSAGTVSTKRANA